MARGKKQSGAIQDWTAEKIKERWLKDKDTARAIQRVELSMRKLDEGEKLVASFPDASVLYSGHSKNISPQELLEPFQERAALLALTQELQENQLTNASLPDQSAQSDTKFSRIHWLGYRTDLERAFKILQPLLGCTQADWERHFNWKGKDLDGAAYDGSRDNNSSTRSSEIVTLEQEAKDFKKVK